MRKLPKLTWITALIITLLVTGHATAKEPEDAVKYCTEISDLARLIMTGRQRNAPMSAMMEIVTQHSSGEKMTKGLTAMIMLAYGQPRYSTERMQQNAINDYANDTFLACMRQHQ